MRGDEIILIGMLLTLIIGIVIGITLITYDFILHSKHQKRIDPKKYKSKHVIILTDDPSYLDIREAADTRTIEIRSLQFAKDKKFILYGGEWIHIDNILDIDEVNGGKLND